MANETRWAPFPAQAAAMGVQSSMSYPMMNDGHGIGALNMYASTNLQPDVGRSARAAQFADRAAGALAVGLRLAEKTDENANLRTALSSRTTIDQAIGILMAQQRCSSEAAFDLLRLASQGRNVKLRDVAARIVAGVVPAQDGSGAG